MKNTGGIITGIITIVIGGTVFTVNQADIVSNFSKDTGLSQEQAQQYIENITEDDLVEWDELGSSYISEGQELLALASDIDCVNYEYEWETPTFTCVQGKAQLIMIGNDGIALGRAYSALSLESASTEDINLTIRSIDKFNSSLKSELVVSILDSQAINEYRNSNSYNKAVLQAVLDSE